MLAEKADFWNISDLQVNYFNETLSLKLVRVRNAVILKNFIKFEQILSLYIQQDSEFRLNEFTETDPMLLSEISYHPDGFGFVKIKSLDQELTEIENINSSTNFYFQVNNKDHFFVEANCVTINEKTFSNLICDEEKLRNPY